MSESNNSRGYRRENSYQRVSRSGAENNQRRKPCWYYHIKQNCTRRDCRFSHDILTEEQKKKYFKNNYKEPAEKITSDPTPYQLPPISTECHGEWSQRGTLAQHIKTIQNTPPDVKETDEEVGKFKMYNLNK